MVPAFVNKLSTALTNSRKCDNTFDSSSTSRSNLELGTAALLSVGTTSGTVCAGDDARLGGGGMSKDTTISVAAGQTAAQTQALINVIPKNLGGFKLTIQFPDEQRSSYNLSLNGFSNGYIDILGNAADNSAASFKNAYLSSVNTALSILNCSCVLNIKYICFSIPSDGSYYCSIINNCSSVSFTYCSFLLTNNSVGIYGIDSNVQNISYYSSGKDTNGYGTAIRAGSGCNVFSKEGYSTINKGCKYGLHATESGRIAKYNSTQPVGVTANELVDYGGQIITPA